MQYVNVYKNCWGGPGPCTTSTKVLRTVAGSTAQSQGSLVACRQSNIFKRDIDNLVCQETDELKKQQMEVFQMLLSVE